MFRHLLSDNNENNNSNNQSPQRSTLYRIGDTTISRMSRSLAAVRRPLLYTAFDQHQQQQQQQPPTQVLFQDSVDRMDSGQAGQMSGLWSGPVMQPHQLHPLQQQQLQQQLMLGGHGNMVHQHQSPPGLGPLNMMIGGHGGQHVSMGHMFPVQSPPSSTGQFLLQPQPRQSSLIPQSGLNNDGGQECPNRVPSRSSSVGSGFRTSTLGEHIENMINKEVNRSTPGPSEAAQEHWKRQGYPPPSSDHPGYPSQQRPPSNSHPRVMGTDERQILRVASLPGQDRPDKPPSRSSDHSHEAIRPPTSLSFSAGGQADPAMARYYAKARRKVPEAAVSSSKPCPGYVEAINDDYLKIMEMNEDEKAGGSSSSASMFTPADLAAEAMSMGPPLKQPQQLETRGSSSDQPPNTEPPRKKYKTDEAQNDAPDSPESGNMVIDGTAQPDSAHSHKTAPPASLSASGSGKR